MEQEEKTPDVEEIKERLRVEIPVEEEDATEAEPDITAEFQKLGRQFAETLKAAWASEERHRVENEVREGLKVFTDEVNKAVHEVRESPAAAKARQEAAQFKSQVESGELGDKARRNLARGLQWLSQEMARLAEQFTPPEKDREEQ